MDVNKAAETRVKILEKAFELFLQKGYHGTSMSKLVNYTGISKGAFYYHFESKISLYEAVIAKYIEPLFPVKKLSTELEALSLQEMLNFLLESYSTSLEELNLFAQDGNANFYSLFFGAFQELPEFRTKVQEFYLVLKNAIKEKLLLEEDISGPEAECNAVKYITRFEGIIFWTAIFPDYDVKGLI